MELPAEAGYDAYAQLAPAAELVEDALACVHFYERCNEARQLQGKEPLFKTTTRGLVAAVNLLLIVAVDRNSFDNFVDLLYILIYEGSGAGSTRLLAENKGVMQREESDALWDIKHLRSKRSRHDIEHGSEGEIRKKYRELKQVLARLGLSRFPQTPEEYRRLQRAVLRNLKDYLAKVADRIESESQ